MKKEVKKLKLNKITISNLDASDMQKVVGGALPRTTWETLYSLCDCPPTFNSICCPIKF
jgi:natural product precursor